MFFLILYFLKLLNLLINSPLLFIYAAPFLEFAREINKKRDDYMTEWRVKARRERVIKARREQAFKAS